MKNIIKSLFVLSILLYRAESMDDEYMNIIKECDQNSMTFVHGIMFSGKSRALISIHDYLKDRDDVNVIAFANRRDENSRDLVIRSRDMRRSLCAYPIENLERTVNIISEFDLSKKTYLIFDESQFIGRSYLDDMRDFLNNNRGIHACFFGLNVDVFGEFFEGSEWFDEHKREKGICLIPIKSRALCPCGQNATFSIRCNERGDVDTMGTQIILEGGIMRYGVRCDDHKSQGLEWERLVDICGYIEYSNC